MDRKLKLGVFGFGCVGQGLYEVLQQTRGIEAEIVKIVVKDRSKKRAFPAANYFSFDKDDILKNPEIDVVVELIDDADAAYEIVKRALENGKAVVTANKKLIAEHFEELFELQIKHNKPILYEAAACASIPIIRNLEEYYDNDLVNNVEGILNGSTNYILTNILEQGRSYESALHEAQEKGFAESDPTLDVGGWDAKYKLCILIAHTYGIFVRPEQVFNYGIDRLSEQNISYAREKGYVIKLVGRCARIDDEVVGFVAPQFVTQNKPLALVNNEYNGVEVTGVFAEKQLFTGKGAGGYPTGSAVLSDISALTYNYRYEYKKRNQAVLPTYSNNVEVDVHVSFEDVSVIDFNDFVSVNERFEGARGGYINGKINLDKLSASSWLNTSGVSVVFFENANLQSNKYEYLVNNTLEFVNENV